MTDILNQTTISCNSCVTWLLTSNFQAYFFIYLSFLFSKRTKFHKLKPLGLFNEDWSALKSDLFKNRCFDGNETMSKSIQISMFTEKCLWWHPFKYSCWYEGLQPYEKVTLSQKLFCKTCEVLQNITFKDNCWSTASDF